MRRLIGIGNDFRRDDAAGLAVVRNLRGQVRPGLELVESSGEGTQLMERWRGAESVILVDALSSGKQPGAVQRFEAHRQALPARTFRYSTHAFSLGEAIELARAMDQLPPEVIVFGIEGKDFSAGEGLSPEVERGVREVSKKILALLESS